MGYDANGSVCATHTHTFNNMSFHARDPASEAIVRGRPLIPRCVAFCSCSAFALQCPEVTYNHVATRWAGLTIPAQVAHLFPTYAACSVWF